MSNLIEEITDYLTLPKTPAGLLSAFASGRRNEEQLVEELVRERKLRPGATDKERRTARSTALRQLQRWNIRGGKPDKQTRLKKMSPASQNKLRRILIRRKFPAIVKGEGIVKSTSDPKDPGKYRSVSIDGWSYRDFRSVLKIAAAAERHFGDDWGFDGEETAESVFNGYYFEVGEELLIYPEPVAWQPYDSTLDWSQAEFSIRSESQREARKARTQGKPGRHVERGGGDAAWQWTSTSGSSSRWTSSSNRGSWS